MKLNKLKSGIKNGLEVTWKISWNVVGDFNDENSFHMACYYNTQVLKLLKAFTNNFSANIKWSKTEHRVGQSERFLGKLLGPLLKHLLPLMHLKMYLNH